MKKTIITSVFLVVLVVFSTSAFAQRQNGPNEKSDEECGPKREKIEMMIQRLSLNDSQVDKVKSLKTQEMIKIKPIKNELGEKKARLITLSTVAEPNKKEVAKIVNEISSLRSEIFMIKSMSKLEVRALLDEEQQLKFDQMSAQRGKRGSKH